MGNPKSLELEIAVNKIVQKQKGRNMPNNQLLQKRRNEKRIGNRRLKRLTP